MDIFELMKKDGYEQVIFDFDKETGMKAIIAIHDSTLGQTFGGVRMVNYASMEDALRDAMRLAKAMTYKCAAADEDKGGSKAVIWGNPEKDKNEAYLRAFGRFIEMLKGRIVTGVDLNLDLNDGSIIGRETQHILARPKEEGSSGSSGVTTAYGIYIGLKACAKFLWGNENIQGKKIAVQGLGAVGEPLLEHLKEGGLEIIATDMNEKILRRLQKKYGFRAVKPEEIYEVDCDIFSPSAIGGILNDQTIPKLKCRIIAGCANNQLEDEGRHSRMLHERGILYAPDYIINAGGVIQAIDEEQGYHSERVKMKTERIYVRLLHIFEMAQKEGIFPVEAANRYAEMRIREIHKMRRLYVPK
ncbi:MAG: Glu/Leu/Phe/Val dehydrogenase dimerization domain-containing protein [Thermodesulfobacteriota bacterium]|nr:Glu/Leu/Phe/Val dehydrogenase dimerization domain-containing protein [Thermodesulfobacteriota bacterium]